MTHINKKYKLRKDLTDSEGLFRIEALKDFSGVKKGDVGGFVQGEHNLSFEGDCWIFDNAKISDNTTVCGDTEVCGDAWVRGSVKVFGGAVVSGNAMIAGKWP